MAKPTRTRPAKPVVRIRKTRDRHGPSSWWGLLKRAVEADREARGHLPDLCEDEVLDWADAYFSRTGEWPSFKSGPIPEAPGETWLAVQAALQFGLRGFSSGGTLARLFAARRGRYHLQEQPFSIKQILAWADAHHARTGEWPLDHSGKVDGAGGLSWAGVSTALRSGRGGLPGGSSLSQLLSAERGVYLHARLNEEQILEWADAHRARTGRWPSARSGSISEAPDENWSAVNIALEGGHRGLRGGSSLARLLVERRGTRSAGNLMPLTIPQILAWADAFHARTGQWPSACSGPIPDGPPGETWSTVQLALTVGYRGFPGGSSLIRLLVENRGVHSKGHRPPLKVEHILRWADAHHERHGKWPNAKSGPIPEAAGETWNCVHRALDSGMRGLPGGSSLPQLLSDERGVILPKDLRRFSIEGILGWADTFHARNGKWPSTNSGQIPESPRDTWAKVQNALDRGTRGLQGGRSLAALLTERRGKRQRFRASDLTIPQILGWADAFHKREGRWPDQTSGAIPESPDTTWRVVENAVRLGRWGLPGGSTLARLLAEKRGRQMKFKAPVATVSQILAWADAWHARTGEWPTNSSGKIPGAGGMSWHNIEDFFRRGRGEIPPGSSLARLLASARGMVRHTLFTEDQILAWADAHHRRTGRWPTRESGPIREADGENWAKVDNALRRGNRGLPRGSSLADLLAKRRGLRIPRRAERLTVQRILSWADAFHDRTGGWPNKFSGPIAEAPGESWAAVTTAIDRGGRGLAGGTTLTRVLVEHRGIKCRQRPRQQHGTPPKLNAAEAQESPGAHMAEGGINGIARHLEIQ
jgi:hypothetical protein